MLRAGVSASVAAGVAWGLVGCATPDDGTTRGDSETGGDGLGDDAGTAQGAGAVPAPAAMVRTSWATDPFALGSYSFLPVGATPEARTQLAEPVARRLFFAGEALDPHNPATVHGARASGLAAAELVDGEAEAGETIVMLGAGIAGASAARWLADAGYEVVVVEGRARVGGRVHTEQPTGWPVPVERGASWVHDIDASDVAERLRALGIATVPFEYDDIVLGVDGQPADDGFADGVDDAIEAAIEWADELDSDVSLAEALARSGAADEVDPVALEHVLRTELTTEYGADADELSAWWGTEEGSDGDDVLVVGGYAGLVESLLDGVDVRTEWPVVSVVYGDDGVAVTRVDGEELEGDRVVVTVPLGVLQAGMVDFDPPLPASHRGAIDQMAMGLLDKVWLRWDEPWWTEPAQQWTRVPAQGEQRAGFAEWFNLAAVGGGAVLLGLIGGAEAREWAERSDDELLVAALASLQHFRDAGW